MQQGRMVDTTKAFLQLGPMQVMLEYASYGIPARGFSMTLKSGYGSVTDTRAFLQLGPLQVMLEGYII